MSSIQTLTSPCAAARRFWKSLALVCLLGFGASALAQTADLAVTQTGLPSPVGAGTNVTYSITVTNAGPNDGTVVILTDTLPPQVTYVSDSAGGVVVLGVVTCPLGTVLANTSTNITIVVSTDCGSIGQITNSVVVLGAESDPNLLDNTNSIVTMVQDLTAPMIGACPANITATNDLDQCSAVVMFATPSASDNCPGVMVACSPTSGSTFPVGMTTVTCTATDAAGNTNACTFTVTVNDTQKPVITCPGDLFLAADHNQCNKSNVTYSASATDNCAVTNITCTPPGGSTFAAGTTTVTCTATDSSGNSASCTFSVSVMDEQPPVVVCPANQTVECTSPSGRMVTYTPTATDNCSSPGNIFIFCSVPSGSEFPIGTTTVTCAAYDEADNAAVCHFTVTVRDTTPPAITCPGNIVTSNAVGQCGAVVSYTTTATDTCDSSPTVTCAPPSGSTFPKGVTTTVNCSAKDASTNTSTCSFTVNVIDTEDPVFTNCPADKIVSTDPGQCTAVVTFAPATACPATVVCSPPSGATFPKGTTNVVCTATAPSGRTNGCSFNITVNDTQAPSVTCPANIVASTDGNQCSKTNVTWTFSATDNCPGVTSACSPTSGSTFPKGVTVVTCSAADTSGNTNACTFTVTINDTQVPAMACSNITSASPGNCVSTITYGVIATDNCPGVTTNCTPPSGTTFAAGTTTVTCTALDAAGNSNGCTFTVTVTTAAPSISAQPRNQTTPMGNGVVFSVTASGTATLAYQWQSNGVNLANGGNLTGATSSSLAMSNLNLSANGNFSVIISNCVGSVTSTVATLTVTPVTAISFDFNTPGQFTNAPYNLVGNDWMASTLVNQQPFGPIVPFEVSTGGVGVAVGGPGLDMMFGQGNDNTVILMPVGFDFSLTGKVLNASMMVKLKVPTAAQRAIEMGFMTSTNIPGNATPAVASFTGINTVGWSAAVFQSTVVNIINPSYQLLIQNKPGNTASATTTTPVNTVTNTAGLITNRWYKLVAQFVNMKSASATGNYTIAMNVQDMGLDGLTPGTNVAVLPPTIVANTDLVNGTNVFFGFRNFENGGIDYIDNIFVTTTNGPVFFVQQPTNQTVVQGGAATFYAMVDGDGPYTYQWFKNGTPIPKAGNWKYTIPQALLSDSGASFTVSVTSTNNSITSSGATLTVTPSALKLLSVGSVDGGVIGLRFNRPVDKTSAETAANYTINGTAAVAAQLLSGNGIQQYRTNGTELFITPAAPISGAFSVTAAGVMSIEGDTIASPNDTAAGVVAGLTGFDVDPTSIGENLQVPTLPGYSYSFAPGQFTIIAGGHDIFGAFDGFRFTYKLVTGDFDVKMRIPYEDAVRTPNKAGFDVRVSLDPAAENVGCYADPMLPGRDFFEGGVRPLYNAATASWGNNTAAIYPNAWLRFRRVGNTFMRYSSTNGVTWLFDGQTSPFPSFPATVYVGLAANCNVGTGTQQQYATSQYESYGDFGGYPGATIAIGTQPAGSTVSAGNAATITVVATGSGGGIPASAGELAYLWQRTNTAAGGWTNMPTAGATNNILSTGALYITDNGAQYRVIISANGALSVTSSVVTITVTDTTAATVSSSFPAYQSPNQIVINFSELMGASALSAANYVVSNSVGGNLGVASVSFLNGDARTVVITTINPVTSGTNFVAINGVQDLNGNATTTVRNFTASALPTPTISGPQLLGPVVTEWYTALASFGNGTHDLVNNPKYAHGVNSPDGSPDFFQYSNVFGIHPGTSATAGFPANGWGENYGVKLYSYFRPQVSANYKFYMRVDDTGELWLNTNANPALSTLPLDIVIGSTSNSPATQQAWMCMDGTVSNYANSKYLNFDANNNALPTGFYVTPAVTNTVVGGIRFWAAGDSPERDPMTFTIEGSPNSGTNGPWTLFASGNTGIGNTGGASTTGRYMPAPDILFTDPDQGGPKNTTPYRSYRVMFPTIRNTPTTANSMQIGEVQLLGNNGAVVVPSGATQIMQVTGAPASFTAANSSSNIFLNGGQLYYMEARFKEGGGGDGCTIAVRTDATLPGNNEVISNQFLVFPTNLAPSTPIQFEAYSGLATLNPLNGQGGFAVSGAGTILDLLSATNLTNFIARIPNMNGYTKIMGWNTNLLQANGTMDNYLGRLYANFIAPSNGLYQFYMHSDDSSQLWMNTNAVNSTDPAGMRLIGQLNAFTSGMTLVGQNVSLTAGQRYYMETRWREGTGGDGVSVVVKSQGDPTVPGFGDAIPGSFFELATNEVRYGPIKLTGIIPSNPTVVEGSTITFNAVGLSGAGTAQGAIANGNISTGPGTTEAVPLLSMGLVWMKNGLDVFKNQVFAGQMYYVTPPLTVADDGSVITLLVSNTFSVATQSVTLHVVPTPAPILLSAVASQYGDNVLVTFSEPMDSFSVQQLANYSIPGLRIFSVKRDDVRRDRVSLQTSRQAQGTIYTLTVNNVLDFTGAKSIAANSSISFSSWGFGGRGGIYVELFTNMPGSLDDLLQFSPKYVYDMPDIAYYTNDFGVSLFNTDSGLNFYAGRVSGLFNPPTNGLYRFFCRGDDGTRIYMNTNGPDPAGRVLIARNDGANSGSYTPTGGTLQQGYQSGQGLGRVGNSISPILSLTNGTGYYMEALFKEGTGGDYLEVVMRAIDPVTLTEIGGVPAAGAGNDISVANGQLLFFTAPGNPANIQITGPPASTNLAENQTLSLNVTVTGAPPLAPSAYQWQRFDGTATFTNIPGATGSNFTKIAKPSDDGAQFRVNVSAVGGANATFTTLVNVTADTTPPTLVSAGSVNGSSIGVCYSEPVNFGAGHPAGTPNSYSINGGLDVASVIPRTDGKSATLILSNAISGPFTVQISGFEDLAATPNLGTGTVSSAVMGLSAQDIGGPLPPGVVGGASPSPWTCTSNVLEVTAGGADVWGTSDQFTYVYSSHTGDFDVRVSVADLPYIGSTWSKAGINARTSVAANAAMAWTYATPLPPGEGAYEAAVRYGNGGDITDVNALPGATPRPTETFPAFVRVVRSIDTFTYYTSTDGVTWVTNGISFQTTNLPEVMLVGLGTVSHIQSNSVTATYSNLFLVPYPVITANPQSQTNVNGTTAMFSVAATTTDDGGPLRYQWRFNGGAIANETNAVLTVTATPATAGNYDVGVKNGGGTVYSAVASLTVLTQPAITVQPADLTVNCPGPADFSVTATGGSLTYQWYTNGTAIDWQTSPTLHVATVALSDSGTGYSVIITNAAGSITSRVAILTVSAASATALANLTNCPGSSATFTTTASGVTSPTYSWTKNGTTIGGANGNSFTVPLVVAGDAGTYCVIVQGPCNSVTNCATLTVVAPPSITTQPGAAITSVGNGASFSVAATDLNTAVYPLTYQWQINGADASNGPNITGATTPSITYSNVTLADNGKQFSVKVTDCAGTTTSSSAALTVVAANDFVTKASQGAGNNWTAAIWSNPPNTAVSSPVAGNTYELIANGTAWGNSTGNTRTRNPTTDGVITFPGDSLTVNTNTDIRFKRSGTNTSPISSSISYFPGVGGNPGLILNGGILNAGDDAEFVVTGNVFVASQSILTGGDNGGGAQKDARSIFLRGKLSGPGNLVILQSSQPTPHQVDADGSGYSGSWIIQAGFLQGLGSNSLGNGTESIILTPTNQLANATNVAGVVTNYSKVEINYDLITTGSLILSNNAVSGAPAVMVLHQNLTFGSGIINGIVVPNGTYTYAQATNAFPANFAPGGSGTITIGTNQPAITQQPTALTVNCPGPADFSVTATGGFLTYLWQSNGNVIRVQSTPTLHLATVALSDSGSGYSVIVSNSVGSVTSTVATLTVSAASATALVNLTNCPGTSATFATTASGVTSPTYSWTKNGTNIPGATASSFTIPSVAAGDAGPYCVIVQGPCNSVTNCATLTVVAPPSITTQPQPAITSVGNGTVFSVAATDLNTAAYPLSYQWQTNGVDIANGPNVTGATTASLTFSNATLAANGLQFSVKVSDCGGTTTSSSALLTVVAANDFVTKASQGAGNNWTATIWSNPPNTAVSSPVAGNTYELIANGTAWGNSTGNTRTRNPTTDGVITFPGDSLTVNTNTDIRFKRSSTNTSPISSSISYFPGVGGKPGLILNGGILNAGDPAEFVVTGNVFVASQSILTGGNNGGGEQQDPRSIFLRGKLSGPGNLVILQSSQPTPHQIDADGSGYSGNWIIQDGFLQGLGSNSLGNGTESILVTPTNQLAAANGTNFSKVEINYDLITTGSLILSNNAVSGAPAVMVLHQNLVFGSGIIDGTVLAQGVYSYAQLSSAFPSNFAAGGSGQITIGPAPIRIVNLVKSGNNFTGCFQTQPGLSYRVQATGSLNPPRTWSTLTTIIGDGTLKCLTDPTATAPERFYRVVTP